ncbi:MAG: bifunctional 2-C-methyl-D-erythritol 4-phosphate cytidylyltransferase/2-C-methyl-D-erythritol 2,4-cyclodiphosphate synthase [Firmicutes bacterium]|nr:bifunctional 2-C-methyl-D-erythritol 4-phosphate cytidylyltransferase/2-C-methyl-D-erythritol 2,4-cyclodiphosphate synthase [Bacillota bacterium]
MYRGKNVAVIIGAAGEGTRMGSALPKQFLKIGEKTILEMAVAPFEQTAEIDEILVITHQDFVMYCKECCKRFSKVVDVIPGGKTRQESIVRGVKQLKEPEEKWILVHDGVRPYVTEEVIQRVLDGAAQAGAAIPVVSCKDTIRQADRPVNINRPVEAPVPSKTLERSRLFHVQTPQGFAGHILLQGFAAAEKDGFLGTDDACLVERIGFPIALVEGSYENIKITTREDLPMERGTSMKLRVGTGFDVHQLAKGRELILGGVKIPYEKGLLGHSDADVMIHALMDAMLGAAGLGDIGRHFPDIDPKYKGISSMKLLGEVRDKLQNAGYRLSNADVTIIAQRPKLAPYIEEMEANIAKTLQIDHRAINVKATTTEKLGFTGRGEGIAAEAVCMVQRTECMSFAEKAANKA